MNELDFKGLKPIANLMLDKISKLEAIVLFDFLLLSIKIESNKILEEDKKNLLNKLVQTDFLVNNIYNKLNKCDLTTIKSFIQCNLEFDDLTGFFYESIINDKFKGRNGVVYTRDNSIIEIMFESLELTDEQIITNVFYDPACGSGLFLKYVARRKIDLMRIEGYSNNLIIDRVIETIIGSDIDDKACFIAKSGLIEFFVNEFNHLAIDKIAKIKEQITTKDFIKDWDKDKLETLTIISNPPYVTLYGKRNKGMTEEERTYYNINFDFVLNKKGNNKYNYVMFFIENSLKLLGQGQTMSLIVDVAFFGTPYISIRKYILENSNVKKIVDNLSKFNRVASGQVILTLTKNSKDNHEFIVTFEDGETGKQSKFPQSYLFNNDEYKFEKPLIGITKEITDKMDDSLALGHYFPKKSIRTCCALTGRTEDFMASDKQFKEDKNDLFFKYLEGSKGIKEKFGALTHTNILNYNYDLQQSISEEFKIALGKLGIKNKKRIHLGSKDAYLSPKIFVRQSAKELIATYTEDKYAANNSIYVLINIKNDTDFLKYMLGIINSNASTFYSRVKKIIKADKGKIPQIKISELKRLPIVMNEMYMAEIIDVVEQLLEFPNNEKLMLKLNTLVYKSYRFKNEEIDYIEEQIRRRV